MLVTDLGRRHPSCVSRIWKSRKAIPIIIIFLVLYHFVTKPARIPLHSDPPWKPLAAVEATKTTVIIIYGEYRTFDTTCAGIFEHLVKPNMPAMVILAVHDPASVTPFGFACLHQIPGIARIVDASSVIHQSYRGLTEFRVANFGVEFIKREGLKFDFFIKVRADNFIRENFNVVSLYGEGFAFEQNFMRFDYAARGVYSQLGKSPPSFRELLWAYIFTAGVPMFIEYMIFGQPFSPFAYIMPSEWNMDLKKYVEAQELSDDIKSFRSALHNLHNAFAVNYIVGCTWLQFGKFDRMVELNDKLLMYYGTMKWSDYGRHTVYEITDERPVLPPTTEYLAHADPLFMNVTESQLRLIHKKLDWNLIDIFFFPDNEKSRYELITNETTREFLTSTAIACIIFRSCAWQSRGDCNRSKQSD